MPRPTRLRSLRGDAGFRLERLSSSGIPGYSPSTRTRWRTFLSIPATSGLSGRSTERPILPRPSARSVPRWRSLWPILLRTCVMRSVLFAIGGLLRGGDRDRFLGRRGLLRRCLLLGLLLRDRKHVGDRLPARLGDLLGAPEALESLDGCLEHVHRVGRSKALGEDVSHTAELEDGADAAAGDDAGSLARRAQEYPRGAEPAQDLVRDRLAVLRDREEVLLRVLDGLGDAVDLDDTLLELAGLFVVAQNSSPPSRAASASAFTRPWYR